METADLGRSFDAVTRPRRTAPRAQLLGGFVLGVAGVLAAGRLLRARARDEDRQMPDEVDEASDESFPASDPPAYTPGHAGVPDHHQDHPRGGGAERAEEGTPT